MADGACSCGWPLKKCGRPYSKVDCRFDKTFVYQPHVGGVPSASALPTTLPTDSDERKNIPLLSGCFRYFPAALAGVARWSKLGNDKHNPGEPLHHARGKSMDHADCILRHMMDLQDRLEVGNVRAILDEADALAWRALALSQELHEKHTGVPLAPGARA